MAGEGRDQQDGDEAGWEREALGCLGDGCDWPEHRFGADAVAQGTTFAQLPFEANGM